MLHRLLAATLVMGGAVALFTHSAQAQSVDIPFTVSVGAICSFQQPTPGVLGLVNGGNSLLASSTTGTLGDVLVQCTAPAAIAVSAPVQTSGPSFTPTSCTSAILTEGAILASNSSCAGTSSSAQIDGTRTLNVGMRIDSGSPIPAGDYAYNVTLTVVP